LIFPQSTTLDDGSVGKIVEVKVGAGSFVKYDIYIVR